MAAPRRRASRRPRQATKTPAIRNGDGKPGTSAIRAAATADNVSAEAKNETDDDGDGAGEASEPDDLTRQLTFSDEGENNPQWSPDGRWLAFFSSRPDLTEPEPDEDEPVTEQVWVLPIDGGEARKVSSSREGVLDFAWMPDSASILYLAPEPRPKPLESVRKEERSRKKIDPVVEGEDRLKRQFWRVEVEARKPKLLFTADYGVSEFALSPDGEKICWATNYTGDDNDYHNVDLFVVPVAAGEAFKLVERPGGKYHLRWSPDSKQIAFLSWLDPALSYSRETLFLADVPQSAPESGSPASQPRIATGPNFDYDITSFDWSKKENAIYALAAVGTRSELYRIPPDGPTERLELPLALRHDVALDPEGEYAVFVQEDENTLPEIVVRDEHGDLHALTKLNADFSETYLLPRQEVVAWTSPDGTKVEGVLTYPFPSLPSPSSPGPLIVQIHGGPKGRATQSLRSYYQQAVWATEGYAVLQPNFRGSEGYGHAFAIANRRDLGGGDYEDIMAGVDWCIAQGLADPDRLGVMGGSYGGFMTNWIIGHTNRFRGAVSMFGIFNLQTDYSNSDLSRWDNDYLGAYYWEDPEIYRKLSPGTYLPHIETPTLILHGDDDNNTFIANSKELYQALKHRGVTTQFVHYPREGHGLREPNHKLDEVRRCLAWMDRYVRHGGQNPGTYRLADRVPSPDGQRELIITKAEIGSYLGQPKAGKEEGKEGKEREIEGAKREGEDAPNVLLSEHLLEVTFTIHNVDVRQTAAPLTLSLSEVHLVPEAPLPSSFSPIGVPLDVPGGKVLVEGDNLRVSQQPDEETAQFGFGMSVVFRVPASGDGYVLRVLDFPPVAVAWSADPDEDEESEGEAP